MTVTRYTTLEYQRRVCLAMNFISAHLDTDLPLEKIAAAASFSMFHFHRIFKAVTGETVAEFTRRLRLEQAANRLLADRRNTVITIAMECGFSSSQNFAKAFKQRFGISPSAYRNSKTGNNLSKKTHALHLNTPYSGHAAFIDPINERRVAVQAEIREMPDHHVAFVRALGPYGQELCEQAFADLMAWAGPRGYLSSGVILGLYWDNPEVSSPEKCRFDACVGIPRGTAVEGNIGTQTIHGGPYAVCRFEIAAEGFHQAWEDAFAWVVGKGFECDDAPCYEFYHNDAEAHPEKKWIVDICIPLRRQ